MTHAWLFTGPPGSGRSNAARAFAAALPVRAGRVRGVSRVHHCEGQAAIRTSPSSAPTACRSAPTSSATTSVVLRCVRRSAAGRCWSSRTPTGSPTKPPTRCSSRWKNRPSPRLDALRSRRSRTSWSPSGPDAGRCCSAPRPPPRSPSSSSAATAWNPELAHAAAAASQGHIGRALGLARDPVSRDRRRAILALPLGVSRLGDCLAAAQTINDEATARASEVADLADEREINDLRASWGVEERGRRPAGYAGVLSTLEKDQKRRRTRLARDSIDGVLIDLLVVLPRRDCPPVRSRRRARQR